MSSLNPDNTYQHESGGDPENIPDLTYENFKHFHDTYYHPSNSMVFMYGNDASDDRFEIIDSYLSGFEKLEVESTIKEQKILSKIADKTMYFDPGESTDTKGYISLNWLLPATEHTLQYAILDKILTGSPTAPLYKTLVESGFGEDVAPFFGFELDLLQPMASFGLKGVNPTNFTRVIELIKEILAGVVRNGLNPKDIDAALNSTEFSLREYDTGRYPKGLAMMQNIIVDWVYNRDFMASLSFEDQLGQIRTNLQKNPRYFEELITKYLIQNTHEMVFNLLPQPGLNKNIELTESTKLASYKTSLTDSQLEALIVETNELTEFQKQIDTPEQIKTLPSLDFADLAGSPEGIPSEITLDNEVSVHTHAMDTSGLLYLDVGFDLSNIDAKLYSYLPLYTRLMSELSTSKYSVEEINQLLDLYTGNFMPAILNTDTVTGGLVRWLFVRGKVLPTNLGYLTDIFTEILLTLKLDNKDKVKQILIDIKSSLEANMISDGRSYGVMAINSGISSTGSFDEVTGGYRYLQWLREAIDSLDANWIQVLGDLQKLQQTLFQKQNMLINLTASQEDVQKISKDIRNFISILPSGKSNSSNILIESYADKTAFIIPTKVNYVCYGVNLKQSTLELSGALDVAVNQTNFEYLWNKVRAQGGAYGCYMSINKLSGVLNIASYRDPRFEDTMADYKSISDYLLNLNLTKEELLIPIVGAIGSFDKYLNPRQKGWTSLMRTLTGRTFEQLVDLRQEILGADLSDLKNLGNVLAENFDRGSWSVFCSQSSFDKVSDKGGYEVIRPI